MKGTISPIEIGNHMSVLGERQGGYGAFVNVPGTDENVVLRATKRDSKLKTIIKEGKPEIRLKIRYEGNVEEDENSNMNLNNPKTLRKIEKQAEHDIIESVEKLIEKMQEEGSDIFGFGEYIRAKQPKYWKEKVKTIEKWRTIYKDMEIHVEMVTHIRRIGKKAK